MAKYFLPFFIIICSFYGCTESYFYKDTKNINKSWSYDNSLDFQFNIPDTLSQYDMLLSVNHSEIFSYNNLYIKINTTFPNQNTVEDIISLNIGDSKGGFLGDCSGGECQETIELQKKFKFKHSGLHTISISQHSREKDLKNVSAITLILDKKQ